MAHKYLSFAFQTQETINEVIYALENKLGVDCSDYQIARMGERLGLTPNKIILYPFDFLKLTIQEIVEDAGYQIDSISVDEDGVHLEIEDEEYDDEE